jgi:hypothetical protein
VRGIRMKIEGRMGETKEWKRGGRGAEKRREEERR